MKARMLKFSFAFLAVFSACSLNQDGRDTGERPAAEYSVTVAPKTFREVVYGMTDGLGVTINNNIQNLYNEAKNQLPATGVASEVTSGTVLSASNLVTLVCFNFVNNERNNGNPSSRRVFREFNFNNAASLTDGNVKMVADRMAEKCLGRLLTGEEQNAAVQARIETLTGATTTQAVYDVAMVLCSGICSSAEALSH